MAAQKLEKSASYRICRYFTPSSLTASQTSSVRERALGSRMAVPLTYRIMLDDHARKVQLENRNEQTAANRVSALRAFLRANCLLPPRGQRLVRILLRWERYSSAVRTSRKDQ